MADRLESALERLDRIEADLGHIHNMLAIQDVLTRYSRALDWLDDAMFSDVFFDDAEIDYGFFKGSGKEFKPLLMKLERSVGRRWHFTSQLKIHISGDTADVESYNFSVAAEPVSPYSGSRIMHFYGKYVDRLEKRAGLWGIVRRRHLQVSAALIEETPLEGPFALLNEIGVTSPAHTDYRRLGA